MLNKATLWRQANKCMLDKETKRAGIRELAVMQKKTMTRWTIFLFITTFLLLGQRSNGQTNDTVNSDSLTTTYWTKPHINKKDSLVLDMTFNTDLCGCDTLSKAEQDSILSFSKDGELIFYFPSGSIKYKEINKGMKVHTICYYPTGYKCTETFKDYKKKKFKEILYHPEGFKYSVCKGKILF